MAQSATTFSPFSGVAWGLPASIGATADTRWSIYRLVAVTVSWLTRPTPAPVGRSQSLPSTASISSSLLSGSLKPPRAKNLMPLSGMGLWEAEIHRSHLDVEHGGQEGHARSGDDAGIDHVESAGAHARGQCGSEKIAGHSRIPADQCTATTFRLPLLGFAIPQHAYGGIAQIPTPAARSSPYSPILERHRFQTCSA